MRRRDPSTGAPRPRGDGLAAGDPMELTGSIGGGREPGPRGGTRRGVRAVVRRCASVAVGESPTRCRVASAGEGTNESRTTVPPDATTPRTTCERRSTAAATAARRRLEDAGRRLPIAIHLAPGELDRRAVPRRRGPAPVLRPLVRAGRGAARAGPEAPWTSSVLWGGRAASEVARPAVMRSSGSAAATSEESASGTGHQPDSAGGQSRWGVRAHPRRARPPGADGEAAFLGLAGGASPARPRDRIRG